MPNIPELVQGVSCYFSNTNTFSLKLLYLFQYLIIIFLLPEAVTQVTTSSDGQSESAIPDSIIPKSVITLVGFALCILIGIAVAKLLDYIHDRLSVRDDASETSMHTKQLLRARTTILAFQEARRRRLNSVDKARDIGKLWKSKAFNKRPLPRRPTFPRIKEDASKQTSLVSVHTSNSDLNKNIAADNMLNTLKRDSTVIEIDDPGLPSQTQPVAKENGYLELQTEKLNGNVCNTKLTFENPSVQEESLVMSYAERKSSLLTLCGDIDEIDNVSSILSAQTLTKTVEANGSLLRKFSKEPNIGEDFCGNAASDKEVKVYSINLEPVKNGHIANGSTKDSATSSSATKKKAWTDISEKRLKSAKGSQASAKQSKRPTTSAATSKAQKAASKGRPVTAGISRPITPGGRNKSMDSGRRR